jgi:very-short-patch-repair endonuclease
VIDGVPCTSLPRTLIDIAPMVGQRGVEWAISKAQFRRVFDRNALARAADRNACRPGVAIIRSVLALDGIERTLTNRELEERFLKLVRTARLPMPLVNERITASGETFRCDFVWRDVRLIVETDGRETHARELQFEEDRRRDSLLKLAGWHVIRFTWRQVTDESRWVLSVVSRFLT